MYECIIGLTCFITGVLLMYAVHRVVFDIYSDKARNTIRKLRRENSALRAQLKQKKDLMEITEVHCFVTPEDVADLKFNDVWDGRF